MDFKGFVMKKEELEWRDWRLARSFEMIGKVLERIL